MAQPDRARAPMVFEPTSVAREQNIVDAIFEVLPVEKRRRYESRREANKKFLQTHQEAYRENYRYYDGLLRQLERIEAGAPPYFARIVGRFRTPDGEVFDQEVRVHAFPYQEIWETPEGTVVAISQRAGLAAVARDPSLEAFAANEYDMPRLRGGRTRTVEPIDVLVEDIEVRDGRVIRVSERYGEVWQERVRGKLAEVGNKDAEFLWEVLDQEQGKIINERPEGYRALLIDGPAGTGKTVIALHYVTVHGKATFSGSDHVWLVAPTPALASRLNPAVQMGLPAELNWRVVSLWDVVRELLPDLPDRLDFEETELAGLKARDPELIEVVVKAYRGAVEGGARNVQRFLQTAVQILTLNVPEVSSRLHQLPVQIGDQVETVNVQEAIEGLPAHPEFPKAARALLAALKNLGKNDPVIDSLLRGDQLESLLAACDTDPLRAYFAGMTTYAEGRGIRQSGPRRLRVEDLGPLLAVAVRTGRTLGWPDPQWVILDEVQSWSPAALHAFRHLLPDNCRLIIAGDLNQRLQGKSGVRTFDEALAALGIGPEETRTVHLRRPYRTPPAILKRAHRVLGGAPSTKLLKNMLHPEPGTIEERIVEIGPPMARAVADAIRQAWRKDLNMIAVLAPGPKRAMALMNEVRPLLEAQEDGTRILVDCQLLSGAEPYQGGLAFGAVDAFQGLEADVVIITDVTNEAYPDDPDGNGRRRLYTAITRARKHLVILGGRAPSRTLARGRVFVRKCVEVAYAKRRRSRGKPVLLTPQDIKLEADLQGLSVVPGNDDRMQDAVGVRPSPLLGMEYRPVFVPLGCDSEEPGVVERGYACFGGSENWTSPPFKVENGPIVLIWARRVVSGSGLSRIEVLDQRLRLVSAYSLGTTGQESQGTIEVPVSRPGQYRIRIWGRGSAWSIAAGEWRAR